MNNFTDDTLSKLVAAKLNHDYISPLTAISNGLEIYKLDEASREEAVSLIDASVKAAIKELQFNRIAFGSFGEDEQISVHDVAARITGYLESTHFKLEPIKTSNPPYKFDAKLWYLCILCMRSSFVQLTNIEIAEKPEGWQLTAKGKSMRNTFGELRAENEWLQIAPLNPNTVQFPLLFVHCDKMKYEIIFKRIDDDTLIVKFWRKQD